MVLRRRDVDPRGIITRAFALHKIAVAAQRFEQDIDGDPPLDSMSLLEQHETLNRIAENVAKIRE